MLKYSYSPALLADLSQISVLVNDRSRRQPAAAQRKAQVSSRKNWCRFRRT